MNLILGPSGPYRIAVGRCGIGEKRREGDGVTPAGTWPVRRVLYRAGKCVPKTKLPATQITQDDGWCDAPHDPAYNTQVKLPYAASHERLWRDDDLYDLVVVLGFNDAPVVAGAGSAIFLHVARPDFGPTEGCVAVSREDLLAIVARLAPGDTVTINP